MQRNPVLTSTAFLFVLVTSFYVFGVFPRCDFRHDDWWILGNSVLVLPKDWSFLFRPVLIHDGVEVPWFFRPFFKGIVYLFYHWFGLNYFLWLLAQYVLFTGALVFGFLSVRRLGDSKEEALAPFVFLLISLSSLAFHFGSLFWGGEGMMNIPQALLLMACTWAYLDSRPPVYSGVALFFFLMAMGFKEASVFHLLFLAGLSWFRGDFLSPSKARIFCWALFIFATVFYLWVRLRLMPWNPSYIPERDILRITKSAILYGGGLLFSTTLFVLSLRLKLRLVVRSFWRARWLGFLPYFLISGALYLGQEFFSPGWWLVPGLCLALVIASAGEPLWKQAASRLLTASLVTFTLSAVLVGTQIHSIGWWYWKDLQVQTRSILERVDPSVTRIITILECPNRTYPYSTMGRVVGNSEALRWMWELLHDVPVPMRRQWCPRSPAFDVDRNRDQLPDPLKGEVRIYWRFPVVRVL